MAELKYRAFVSFSHEADEKLAVALQSSLSRFAKPWYRTRSMRVFQDEASLAANPALWDSIQQALAQSEFLLLLASPTHQLIGTLSFQQKAIHSIAMEPGREILASVDEDDNLIFWSVGIEDWIKRACRIANRNLTAQEWNTHVGPGAVVKTCPGT